MLACNTLTIQMILSPYNRFVYKLRGKYRSTPLIALQPVLELLRGILWCMVSCISIVLVIVLRLNEGYKLRKSMDAIENQ